MIDFNAVEEDIEDHMSPDNFDWKNGVDDE